MRVDAAQSRLRRLLNVQRGRKLREYLTGYLMVLPATVLIFVFGIFPVAFALFVSVYKWRLKRGDYIGLRNYFQAAGDLTYVLLFGMAIGAAIAAYFMFRRLRSDAGVQGWGTWLLSVPGLALAALAFSVLRWAVLALPPVLDIADKIIGKEHTRALFMQLLGEALAEPQVATAWRLTMVIAAAVIVSVLLVAWLLRLERRAEIVGRFSLFWLAVGLAGLLGWYTYTEVLAAGQQAAASGNDLSLGANVVLISAGVVLLALAWFAWQSAAKAANDWSFWGKIMAAGVLLVAGWVFISQLPTAIAQGDPDMWQGLVVTAYYSAGTVPFQLAIGMGLAILLFQRLRGSELFRMLFFLPYVTPIVASAAVFRQLFSTRLQSPANQILKFMGLPASQWLRDPNGIFDMIGKTVGVVVPPWLVGPSLALVVIILYNIWVYAGYDAVIYLAGLGNIDQELIEAAEIDGASGWQVFRNVIFPLLSPTTYFLSLIAVIGTFKAFTQIWVMTVTPGGGSSALGTTDTFSVVIFREFYTKLRYGYASALAFVLFAVILGLTLLNNRIQGSRVFYG